MHRDFHERQRHYWRGVDLGRFEWQTQNPVIARREAELVGRVALAPGDRLLEIGCGEGANLHHLRHAGAVCFGVDFSAAKADFARRSTAAHTVTADGARLPFRDGGFDVVLIRDVLHHVPVPAAVLAEAQRVLRPGGRLWLIEPNVGSPLIWLQMALLPAERGVVRSTAKRLRAALEEAGLRVIDQTSAHPLPIERALLHPGLGAASLARSPLVTRALGLFDELARRWLPQAAWMYLVFEATRPEDA